MVRIGVIRYNDHSRASESKKVDKDVCLRYKDRVQKTHSFFDLNEAIFFYRKIGWYRERPFVPIYIYMYIETRGLFLCQ